MNTPHLLRLRIDAPALMRFAGEQGLLKEADDGFGYVLHAWLAAMFGTDAPKPFRHLEPRSELLGYARVEGHVLLARAQSFASPQAWAALKRDSLVTKPMPTRWAPERRLQVEVLACPVTRKDDHEKDIYLRALDRLGDDAPTREEVYLEWFRRQWSDSVQFEHVDLVGFGRSQLMRRVRSESGSRRLRAIERPHAMFRAVIRVRDSQSFNELLTRGIGRHRAFGFGMPLVAPAP